MTRVPIVAGNWKMQLLNPEAAELARGLLAESWGEPTVELVVCPSFPALSEVGLALSGSRFDLGAQDLHWEAKGAFTGEVSAAQLLSAGCRFVIVGHSERRHALGEDEATAARKARAAVEGGLTPIFCVGETLDERDSGEMESVLARQLEPVLRDPAGARVADWVLAYEPVWAIGTGRTATPQQAQEAHAWLRAHLRAGLGEAAKGVRILYGGSVTAENAASLLAEPDVDGALVGGASLKAADFAAIARAAADRVRASR